MCTKYLIKKQKFEYKYKCMLIFTREGWGAGEMCWQAGFSILEGKDCRSNFDIGLSNLCNCVLIICITFF
jgi:hypothetical protein